MALEMYASRCFTLCQNDVTLQYNKKRKARKYSYTIWNLVVIEDLKIDEELTVKYEWYKPVERVVM